MFRTYQPKKLREERARLQKENGHQKRPQSSCAQKSKRQKTADLLIPVRQPVADRQHIQRILFEGMPGGTGNRLLFILPSMFHSRISRPLIPISGLSFYLFEDGRHEL